MTQQFIQKFAMLDPIGYHQIYRPWSRLEEYKNACEWLASFKWEDAHWDFGSGISNINNVQYPTRVFFEHEEDLLAFKLKFSSLLKW
jgi:hypothetical protein